MIWTCKNFLRTFKNFLICHFLIYTVMSWMMWLCLYVFPTCVYENSTTANLNSISRRHSSLFFIFSIWETKNWSFSSCLAAHLFIGKCKTVYLLLQQPHSDSPLAGRNRPGPPRRSSPAPRSSASPQPRTEPSTSAGRWLWWRAPAPSCAASATARRTPPGSARWCPGWAAGWPRRTGRSRRRAQARPSSSRWSTRCGTAAARSSPCPSSGGSRRRCGWCRWRRGTFAQSVGPPPTAGRRTGSR